MGPGTERSYGSLTEVFPLRKLAGALDLLPLPSLVLGGGGAAMAVNEEWTLLSGLSAEASWGRAGSARSSRWIGDHCGAGLRGRRPRETLAAAITGWPAQTAASGAAGGGGRARRAG